MNYLYCFVICFCFSAAIASGKAFEKAKVFFKNEEIREGLISSEFASAIKKISFKETENAEVEKFDKDSISKVILLKTEGDVVYRFMMVHKGFRSLKVRGPILLREISKGTVSLYTIDSNLTAPGISSNSHLRSPGMPMNTNYTHHTMKAQFTDYYLVREDEIAPRLVSSVADINKNACFKMWASKYFSDYPDLSKKIKTKEYRWDEIEKVVEIYNTWAESNKD